ncbi:hypothetical protein [Streptomyces sp. NPDC008139]|uniref:hypothetical protein n=1 Tax=Streptomyces sp. NPDC008139 TaxID=3364814 RepID=UPI0036EE9B5E
MGFIKDVKVQTMKTEAQKAIDAGQHVFVCRINQGALQPNWSGPLVAVAEQIEAIEGLGWALDQSTFAHDNKGHASAFLIFRRPKVPELPQQQAPGTSWGARG